MNKSVVSFCDRTGNMVKPWAEAGYLCYCYDWQHRIRRDHRRGNIIYRWADLRSLTPADLPPDVRIAFAFPDCTHLALSGARDFERKGLQPLIDALVLVESCRRLLEYLGVPYVLENPMSRLSTCWREPDYKYSPWMYGEDYQKETWLWTGGGFVMPPPLVTIAPDQLFASPITKPDGVKQSIWEMPPSKDRANLRAVTPMKFARAVFEANHAQFERGAA